MYTYLVYVYVPLPPCVTLPRDINDTWRNLFKASKALAEHEGISNLALSVRAEIDEFKPLMPIITALRNPGLRER